MIRIAILEDDRFLLKTLEAVLKHEEGIEVVHTYTNGDEALIQIKDCNDINVCLTDIDLGKNSISGIEFILRMKERCPNILFLVLTIYEDHDKVFNALSAGALGYIIKSTNKRDIVEAIHEIVEGGSPMSPSIARKIAASFSTKQEIQSPFSDQLTAREKEVLECISRGRIEKEVASELNISLKTVKAHISNIYGKLQVHTRVEALNKYYGKM